MTAWRFDPEVKATEGNQQPADTPYEQGLKAAYTVFATPDWRENPYSEQCQPEHDEWTCGFDTGLDDAESDYSIAAGC